MKLVLFDVDNTLIKNNRRHRESFTYAFLKIYGIDAGIDIINPEGKTDQQIIIEVLEKKGIIKQDAIKKIKSCMQEMVRHYKTAPIKPETAQITLIPGALELLKNLNNCKLGLVTGNVEEIAYEKLNQVGIRDYFKVGGFGSDSAERYKLVNLAIERAGNPKIVFVIGDTPLDIEAARKSKYKPYSIGVATGKYSFDELSKTKADLVVNSLDDKKVLEFIDSF